MEEAKRARRDRRTVLTEKCAANNEKIAQLQQKIDRLKSDNAAFEQELRNAETAARRASEKAEQAALIKLIRRSGKSAEEIRAFFAET